MFFGFQASSSEVQAWPCNELPVQDAPVPDGLPEVLVQEDEEGGG